MNTYHRNILIVLSFAMFFVSTCSKEKQETKTSDNKEKEFTYSGSTEEQMYSIEMNYDSLLYVFEEQTALVTANPFDLNSRKKLVKTCYDSSHHRIITFGIGKPPVNARTPSIGMKMAEQAAKIQAYRWAAFVQKWRLDPSSPDTSITNARLPGGQILSRLVMPDSTIKVLLEIRNPIQ